MRHMQQHDMTQDEIQKIDFIVDRLNDSFSLEDRICGILMDINVGRIGYHMPEARAKAHAINNLFEVWMKTQTPS
jgi:hypothetical protein